MRPLPTLKLLLNQVQGCLAYESPVIRNLHSLMSPRVVLGWNRAQSQRLSIPLAEKVVFQKGSNPRAALAFIEIGRRDFTSVNAKEPNELHVYDARLRFDACFSGLRCVCILRKLGKPDFAD